MASRSSNELKSLLTPICCSTTTGVTRLLSAGSASNSLSSSPVNRLKSAPIESAMICSDLGSIDAPLSLRYFSMKGNRSRSFIFLLSKSIPTFSTAEANFFLLSIVPFLWHITSMVDCIGCDRYLAIRSVFLKFCASFTMTTCRSDIIG